ncbi:nuclear transport factor 2 family protein [Marinicella rhabdoformis]|uniref:nuclear transport factor 2 family protein n=1 Tax=Marinicella rhabdoformis TaxID=2580566 RepID=UPI001C5545A7|nr:nuclear transport factor 2 family protein [Marinicella rhabdoformis]
MKTLIILTLIAVVLIACTRSPNLKLNRSESAYKSVISNYPATSTADAKTRFESVFKNFHIDATEQNIRALYADKFHFNDTFVIMNDIEDLVPHMIKTAKNVEITTVDIHEVIKTETDYYLKWTMHMKFTAVGKNIDSLSMGMSQLRFNEQGKVIFHQDYWDGSENLYEHLPLIGRFVKKIKSQL